MKIYSPVFNAEDPIPSKYTCQGENISFPLEWEGIPDTTKTLAIIFDDPDAPGMTWVHWVIYNIPASLSGLPENIPPEEVLPNYGLHGLNSWRKIGYGGPCPPFGTHRYFTRLYALDCPLPLKAGLAKKDLIDAMMGSILEEAQMYGTYKKN